jgi:CPA2 family monovalent cation:H+ antiporter-2
MDGISLLQDFAVILVVAGISGWVFRRLGLSAVVGYLVAGIIIGPYTPPFTLVSSVERIETLTDLGLAFLMFFVGLGLSLKRIRRLGAGVVATTAVTALCVFQLSQGFAALMGWDSTTAFLFAAMLMTSSSAIITKMLAEAGLTHERFAQNAQGVTVLEDVVAIVLLTLLGSKLAVSDAPTRSVENTLFLLVAFAALIVVLGLIFIPKLLSRFGRAGDADLHSVLVSGLLFLAGAASISAGFSVALGSFLFGVVIAETRFKSQIEKSLGGAQDMFSAIFFVAIGMLIDVKAFWEHGPLILGISVFAIFARALSATVGFTLAGQALPLAAGSAIVVTPIGEFAYVIAQLGVDAGAVPRSFYAIAVGVSIVTAICAPLFAKRADRFGGWVSKIQPAWLEHALLKYQGWLAHGMAGIAQNHVWRLTRRRVGWTAIQLLLLGGLFGFANSILSGVKSFAERAGNPIPALEVIYWCVFLVPCLVLLLAIWQNLQTLCLIYGEAFATKLGGGDRPRIVAQFVFQVASFAVLAIVLLITFPIYGLTPVFTLVLLAVPLVLSLILWKQLAGVHQRLESSIMEQGGSPRGLAGLMAASSETDHWNLELIEVTLPEFAECAGKEIRALELRARFGCSILEINRQGHVIDKVKPGEALYPGDSVLLFGTGEQIARGAEYLRKETTADDESRDFSESILELIPLAGSSRLVGVSLAESQITDCTGVHVIGIERNGERILNPQGKEVFQKDDLLLVLGSGVEIRAFRHWLGM